MTPASYWKDSGEQPAFRKQLKRIDDPVAESSFTYHNAQGKRVTSRIIIGSPQRVPDSRHEWYCPVIIENWFIGILPILGMDPVTALMNAGSAVRAFLEINVFYPGVTLPWHQSGLKAEAKQKPKKRPAKPTPKKLSPKKPSPGKSSSRKRA